MKKKIVADTEGLAYGPRASVSPELPRDVSDSISVIESNIDKLRDIKATLQDWCYSIEDLIKTYSPEIRSSRVSSAISYKDLSELRELFINCDHWNAGIEAELAFAVEEFQDCMNTIGDNLQDIRDYFVDNDLV